jgi:flagellar basal-body rod protein FlgB
MANILKIQFKANSSRVHETSRGTGPCCCQDKVNVGGLQTLKGLNRRRKTDLFKAMKPSRILILGRIEELNMLAQMMTNLDFQGQALVLRSQRQQVLASNIANADTPGYIGREFNFAQKLMQATGQGAAADAGVQSTHAAHMPMSTQGLSTQELYAMPSQNSADKNTVDMDRERASFSDNALHYEATLRFINGNVRTILSAITGQ